jgi:hypothetical protein
VSADQGTTARDGDRVPRRRPLAALRARHPGLFYVVYLSIVSSVGAYALFVAYRSDQVYTFLKLPHRGFRGHLYQRDDVLGWAPRPGGRGEMVFRTSPPLPVRFDDDGFRVPAGAPQRPERPRPWVLALGCSFTFGDACLAEHAYAQRVADGLGGTALNAGLCGGSLAQMLIRARQLIPRHKPDYVLAQYSPWLLARGSSGFGRSSFGLVTTPFFYRHGAALEIHPPLPGTTVFDLPFHDFDNDRRGPGEYASFLFRAGGPLALHDDLLRLRTRALRALGRIPPAASRGAEVLPPVYQEIADLCRRNGARLMVTRLSQPLEARRIRLPDLEDAPGVVLVDAQADLNAQARDLEDYDRKFRHWRPGKGLLDPHPNPAAHEVIAAAILRALAASSGRPK